jgi:hypothetical protein
VRLGLRPPFGGLFLGRLPVTGFNMVALTPKPAPPAISVITAQTTRKMTIGRPSLLGLAVSFQVFKQFHRHGLPASRSERKIEIERLLAVGRLLHLGNTAPAAIGDAGLGNTLVVDRVVRADIGRANDAG